MSQYEEIFMQRCLELANQGLGTTRSNPMVGAVLVYDNRVVAEGYHQAYGKAHAEVNAINSLQDKNLLKQCTLYVNLEPCSHHGKTPPCADLVIASGIKNVVVGAGDPNPAVNGNGIHKLIESGCQVKSGILESECRELNKRFYTYHEKKRPWILLKWAESSDGFLAKENNTQTWISGEQAKGLVQTWRTQEMSILVGTKTAKIDNPKLTARIAGDIDPIRIVLDRNLSLPVKLHLFDSTVPTLVFTEKEKFLALPNVEIITTSFEENLLAAICAELHSRKIISCMIEGGAQTLNAWIQVKLWDEARVFKGPQIFGSGIKAPQIDQTMLKQEQVGQDLLSFYCNAKI